MVFSETAWPIKLKFYVNYEGCSLILVIDSFSPKPSSLPDENYLVVIDKFFVILKSPTDFKMIELVMAN